MSSQARESIAGYLEEQLAKHEITQQLAASFTCDDTDTVRQRIAESEASQHLTDEEYKRSMDEFFCQSLPYSAALNRGEITWQQ